MRHKTKRAVFLIKSANIFFAWTPQMNFTSRWIKKKCALSEMNWNDFNCVSTVKPTECKDLFIRLKEQCLSRPCPAVNAISQAYLDLSAKLNSFFSFFFFLTKHPHYSCPSIIYVSKLHSNISSFNSMKGLSKKKSERDTLAAIRSRLPVSCHSQSQ